MIKNVERNYLEINSLKELNAAENKSSDLTVKISDPKDFQLNKFFYKNEFWMLIFSLGVLYWLFNPSVLMALVMIIPLLLAVSSRK